MIADRSQDVEAVLARTSRNFPSIRRKITLLVLASVMPALFGTFLLIVKFYEREREQLVRDAVQTAHALVQAVDRDLGIGQAGALALATSPNLADGDLAAFHRQATSLLQDRFPGFNFVLSDQSGQQLVNTVRPFSETLPRHGNPDQLRRVFETGLPVISDLYIGGVLRRPLISIDVPVKRDGKVVYDLSVSFLPEHFARILGEQRLPADYIVSIYDTRQVIVARTHAPETFVGRAASAPLAAGLKAMSEGMVESVTLDGVPVYSNFSRSPVTGWAVAIGIPRTSVFAELLHSVAPVLLSVTALIVIGLGMAWLSGGRISRSVIALVEPLIALGAGRPVEIASASFREAEAVAMALRTVEAELNDHRLHLESLVADRTARLEHVLLAAGEGIYGVDVDNRITFANQATADLLGWPDPQDLLGLSAGEATGHLLADGRSCDTGTCPIAETLKDGRVRRVHEEFFTRKDGGAVPVEYVAAPLVIAERVDGAVVVFSDIGARKEIERHVNELLDLNQKIVTECPVGIVAYRVTGECVLVNEAYARILGGTVDDMLGDNFRRNDQWKADGLLDRAMAALADGLARKASAHHITAYGREVWVDIHFVPFTRGGEPHLLCIKHDVTAWYRSEMALDMARQAAEQASRAKSEFVANMSHEIRTPMSAIMGLAGLLEDGPLGEQERDYVVKIKRSAQSLLGILNDILDFSKIEAGRLELERIPFSLEDVLGTISVVVETNARHKGIKTVFTMAADVPLHLVGDPLRLQQVLLNLTGNAVKFTEKGEVVLSVTRQTVAESGVMLEFSIKDTGIGIPEEQKDRLFQAFSQADSSTSRHYGGTGLGLAISSRLVALMGGTIAVDSQPGRGSEFRFTATFGLAEGPFAPHEPRPARPPSLAGRLKGFRVLLVEDNQINQDVARDILLRTGAVVEIADDGQMAIDFLERGQRPVDAVLMDIQMPGMDGYEATKRIRSLPGLSRLPVIAMTANAMQSDRQHSLMAGMNAHIAKPIDLEELIGTLSGLIPGHGVPMQPEASPTPSHPAVAGIDMKTALIRLGGDFGLLSSLLGRFAHSEGHAVAEVRALIAEEKMDEAAGRLHRLRGVAANLGAVDLAGLASEAEAAVKDAKGGEAALLLDRLEAAMTTVIASARQLAPPPPAAETGDVEDGIAALGDLLGKNNFKAVSAFAKLRPALESAFGAPTVQTLAKAIDTLDFPTAARLLSELRSIHAP